MPSLFLWLKRWHAPAGHRTCDPRPLVQARQIRPAAPVGARNPGTRPTDRFAGQPDRRQPNLGSGRDPGELLTLRPLQHKTGEAGPEALSTVSLPNLGRRYLVTITGHVRAYCRFWTALRRLLAGAVAGSVT